MIELRRSGAEQRVDVKVVVDLLRVEIVEIALERCSASVATQATLGVRLDDGRDRVAVIVETSAVVVVAVASAINVVVVVVLLFTFAVLYMTRVCS